MSDFMTPDIQQGRFYLIETTEGTEVVPGNMVGRQPALKTFRPYINGKMIAGYKPEEREGFYFRMSASGYMDCTDWSHAETEAEAIEELLSTYGSDAEDPKDMYEWEVELMERLNELMNTD